ncbi:SUMO ligase siz1 [Haplosporangium sp. Z 27]|nr:SUMO ligase siz1 [Haplosporangium sp. Z 27]
MEDLSTINGRIIPGLLVSQLKSLIKNLNETIRPAPQLRLSGNKSDLIGRLNAFITQCHQNGDQVVIRQIRHCIAAFNQGELSTIATPSVSLHHNNNPTGSSSSSSSSSSSNMNSGAMYRMPQGNSKSMHNPQKSNPNQSLPSHYQPLMPPRISHMVPQQQLQQHRPGMSGMSGMQGPSQVFKSSPFFKDVQTLTSPRLCIEAKDRTVSVPLQFTVPPMLATQLKKDPEYQLMVFCGWADGPSGTPVLMEFPHVCEIKVNGIVLEANLRGMKNKPGTVAPANITKLCRLEGADFNKVDFIYANSTKRYYASIHVVKRTSVESIVSEIERGKFLSKEKMLQLIEDRNKDEDIMATSSTLSLKCPLGFQRIKIPCRSSYCQHLQCFDALTFFNLNEQTPTWTCPVCSRNMHSWEEIVIDGSTPNSLESITVQADGSWELPSESSQTEQTVAPSPKKKVAPSGSSVFVIDEDDSDSDQANNTVDLSTPVKPTKPAVEVIDLISDSEDDGEEPVAPQRDGEGDTTMQEAANSLQNMAQATPGASVKTEVFDKPTPTESSTAPPPIEIHSIAGSVNASRSASSEPSPVVSSRMGGQAEIHQTGPPVSGNSYNWVSKDDEMSFVNALMYPRRKRQFDDTGDNEGHNSMSYEARQRIARLDIHSNASSERGSTIPSPDLIRRSTSSPTPVPTFHDFERRGLIEHHIGADDALLRSRREQVMSRSANMTPYYENGSHHSGGPSSGRTSYTPPRFSPQHHQSHISQGTVNRGARGATVSPPIHHGYNGTSPRHHHHSNSRSPGPDYYASTSRPPSNGSTAAPISMSSRSNSTVAADRPYSSSSNTTSGPGFNGSTSAWSSDDYPNGGLDRGIRGWGGEQRSSPYLNSGHLSHGYRSPRRTSAEESRLSPSPPGQHSAAGSSKYPSHQQQHSSYQYSHTHNSSNHQRHHSNDEVLAYGRREDRREGGHNHRSSYSIDDDEGRRGGYGHPQHVYSPNQTSQSSVHSGMSQQNPFIEDVGSFEDRQRIESTSSSKDDDAPIFAHGFRGARAR